MKNRFMITVNSWIYGNASLADVVGRAAACGFDGIELVGEPSLYEAEEVNRLVGAAGLRVFSICGMHPGPDEGDLRLLSHPDADEREKAVQYVKSCIDLAVSVGARSVLVVPSLVGQPNVWSTKEKDIDLAVESLKTAGAYAESREILLTIEPINRYEVGLINTVAEAIAMAERTGSPAVRVMGDTFHMQIEEGDGIPNAIRRAGGYWFQHLHVADNTREAPGLGTMPWREIINALFDLDYQGVISYEPLPRGKAPYDARNGNIPRAQLDSQLKLGVDYLRREMEIAARYA